MKTNLLSKQKIRDLQKEVKSIKKAIIQVTVELKQDGHMHEGIIEEVNLQPKRKRLMQIERILGKSKELHKKSKKRYNCPLIGIQSRTKPHLD